MRSGSSVAVPPSGWCHVSLEHLMLLCKCLSPWSEDLSEELGGRHRLLIFQLVFFSLARKLMLLAHQQQLLAFLYSSLENYLLWPQTDWEQHRDQTAVLAFHTVPFLAEKNTFPALLALHKQAERVICCDSPSEPRSWTWDLVVLPVAEKTIQTLSLLHKAGRMSENRAKQAMWQCTERCFACICLRGKLYLSSSCEIMAT